MITQFALLLSHGMSLMWCLMPRKQVTCGFFRIQLLVVLGLSVLAALAAGRLTPTQVSGDSAPNVMVIRAATIVTAVFAYLGAVFWRIEQRTGGTWCLCGVFGATLVGLYGLTGSLAEPSRVAGLLRLLSVWSSAAVLGGATTGMLLGHWYLTAPTMSIEPLKRVTQILFGCLVLRLIVSAWGWSHADGAIQGSLVWTWFSLRWLAGILAPWCSP